VSQSKQEKIVVIIITIIRGWIQRKIRVGQWSDLRHRYMPLPQQKSRRRVILSMNNLTLRCHLGKRWLWLWAGHDMKEPANGNEKQGCARARWQRGTMKRDVES
jgi:hypothetical protein